MNLKAYFNKTTIYTCLLIALCFLWTGSGYLSWMYHLLDFYPPQKVDILTEVVGYIFQVFGLALVAICEKKHGFFNKTILFIGIALFDYLFITLSITIPIGSATIVLGFIMNLFHGLVAGIYLSILSALVAPNHCGFVFGTAYAIGSIGSYLLSSIGKGNFLCNPSILILYACFVLVTIVILFCGKSMQRIEQLPNSRPGIHPQSLLIWAGILVILLSLVKNIGFYFPMSDLTGSNISLEFTRIFYAVGLVIAGLINDYKRKWGAVTCVASLIFPFAMLLLNGQVDSRAILWIISYFFFAFFVTYRIVLFVDLSVRGNCLFLAGVGLLCGRVGDALGAGLGMALKSNIVVLVFTSFALFTVTVILFFYFYEIYYTNTSEGQDETIRIDSFIEQFGLTAREKEVLILILKGNTNSKIADNLFISESTVKFHVKNILKKTQCANRKELLSLLNSAS
ncbi:MAG: helix-turn-helix transcriptional regulator [Lachnospiraceae bacterium]|nr:helix-turn-helix transcriptional regulator [Lachnospiraceae bacterium]